MSTQKTLKVGQSFNFGSLFQASFVGYAGLLGDSFSLIWLGSATGLCNLYFPIKTEFVELGKDKIRILEVHPDRIVLELN